MIELNRAEKCGLFYGPGDTVKLLKDKDVFNSEQEKYPSFDVSSVLASIETRSSGHTDELFLYQLEPGDFGFQQGMMFLFGSKFTAKLS